MKKIIIQGLFFSLLLSSTTLRCMEGNGQQLDMNASSQWQLMQGDGEATAIHIPGLPPLVDDENPVLQLHVSQDDVAAQLAAEQAALLALSQQTNTEKTLPQIEPPITLQDLLTKGTEKWHQTSGGKKALFGTAAAATIGLIGIGGYYIFANK